MTQRFTRDNLPTKGWAQYRVVNTTTETMCRIDGPFIVENFDGITYCDNGFLAHNREHDFPYAVPHSAVLPEEMTYRVPVYVAVGDRTDMEKVGSIYSRREIENPPPEVVHAAIDYALRNGLDHTDDTGESPVYIRVGENGDAEQVATITADINVKAEP